MIAASQPQLDHNARIYNFCFAILQSLLVLTLLLKEITKFNENIKSKENRTAQKIEQRIILGNSGVVNRGTTK